MEIWTYCLMPNHVHLLAVPETPSGLARPIGEAHRRYALAINKRQGWSGHLWQERFASFPMSEAHLLAAARYVLLNPVRAGLAEKVLDWPHSSARAHLFGAPDPLVTTEPLAARIEDWASFLSAPDPDEAATIRLHSRTGRPLGSPAFVDLLERSLDRRLRPMKRGPRRKRTS